MEGKIVSGQGRTTTDGARARLHLLLFVSALLACAAPEIREDCRFVHEHVPPPPMPAGFDTLDRALLGRLMLGTAAVRELSERPRLRTRIQPLHSLYASRNTVALRRLFAEDLLGRFCARLEVARARASSGQVREAGVAYEGLLVASQVLQLNVALLQMAVYADEAGQPVAQIQQLALRPLVQLEPLLDASLADDPKRLTAELPSGVERYNASVAGLDRWAADLKLGAERVKVARILWDTLLASAAAIEMAAVMAEAAAASMGPPSAVAALAGGGGAAQLVLNKAVVIEVAGAIETLITVGAVDGAVIAGLHAMAASAHAPPSQSRPSPLVQPTARPEPTVDRLSKAAGAPDQGGFTAAGRSLTKHGVGARLGNSRFPQARGNPSQVNQQAQNLVDDILTNPGSTFTKSYRGRFGETLEVTAPDGRGIVYDADGKFLFFKE